MIDTLEESLSQTATTRSLHWVRRTFQAPQGARWVPEAFAQLTGLPALPAMRGLRKEPDGSWSIEEYQMSGQMSLGPFLTQSAAPIWVFVSIVQQSLAGLMALHQKGFRHGAISPESLQVNGSGHVLLSGCGGGDAWENAANAAADGSAPPLPQKFAVEDLQGLGRTFRAVLGGDPLQRLTATRTDIAPLVAEWIDWLAEPPRGHEPDGAVQAAAIFNDIRAGRPSIRPWKEKYDLPTEVAGVASAAGDADVIPARKRNGIKHGAGFEIRPYAITALILIILLGGGSWILVQFLKPETERPSPLTYAVERREIATVQLPDEDASVFDRSGGDIEPLAGTAALVADLLGAIGKQGTPPRWPQLEVEEKLRATEAALAARGEKVPAREASGFLQAADIFPALGQATAGRTQGDFYLVWRTQNLVMTNGELRATQSAILRTARYCGVRIMSWVVLPNQAGVVLRVPARRLIPDDSIERRIAILRGEKTAESVMRKINACLKAGDNAGADQIRLTWVASMGSAAGFYSVLRTVPVVSAEVLAGRPLWQEKPLRFAQLIPKTGELRRAAVILDAAAVKGNLTAIPREWPYNSLTACILNYGPALRAVSVLMQKDPGMDMPVPPKEEQLAALTDYRRLLGDLPEETAPSPSIPGASGPVQPASGAVPVASRPPPQNQ